MNNLWKPIEEAPKDGTILFLKENEDSPINWIGYFKDHWHKVCGVVLDDVEIPTDSGRPFKPSHFTVEIPKISKEAILNSIAEFPCFTVKIPPVYIPEKETK